MHGLRLHYRDWLPASSDGQRQEIVLAHGLSSTSHIWDLVAPRLAERYRVVAVDQRGHGESDQPDDGYDFPSIVADLHGVLGAAHVRPPAVLVGHSWGASVVVRYAAEHPAAVAGLALVDGGIGSPGESWSWDETLARLTPPHTDGLAWSEMRERAARTHPDLAVDSRVGTITRSLFHVGQRPRGGGGRRHRLARSSRPARRQPAPRRARAAAASVARPRRGRGRGRNAGLRASRGRVVVLADASVELCGDALGPLVSALDDPSVGAAGPFGLVTADFRHFCELPEASADQSWPREVDALQNYLLAFRRADLPRIGWLDERFRFYRIPDLDLSCAIRTRVGRVVTLGGPPVVRHRHALWEALAEGDREERSRKNFGRFLKQWDRHPGLLRSAGAREAHAREALEHADASVHG